jgi:chemotaxis protein MotA
LLNTLDDPSGIGPAMAVALVTTFYGSVLANFICNPIASKLSLKSKEEIQEKRMIIEGVLSIQAGENPKILEHKLKSFLSPREKLEYDKLAEDKNAEGNSQAS